MQPLVSVVVANYNYARFLPECIDSILAQTHQPIEIIVVDDGSTDNSRVVLESYGTRIHAVFQENAGQAAALSAGVALARGEYVALLDADDTWLPHKVARVVELLDQHPDVQWVRHKFAVVDERLEPLHSEVPAFRGSERVPPDISLLLEAGLRAGTSLVMRRALSEKVFPVVITPELALDADDTIILARIFATGATGYSLDEVLAQYRRHGATRFDSNDLIPSLKREAALASALGTLLDWGEPSSSYKLRAVVATLEGRPRWHRERLLSYVRGLAATRRLWSRPRLLTRQVMALTFAVAAPNLWLRKMLARGVPPTPSDQSQT